MFWYFLAYIIFYFILYFHLTSMYIVSAILAILSATIASYLTIKINKLSEVKKDNILINSVMEKFSNYAIAIVVLLVASMFVTILVKFFDLK